MNVIGFTRKVDKLGRVVLPIQIRRALNITVDQPMEIYVDGPAAILRKPSKCCIFCGSGKEITVFKGKNICHRCLCGLKDLPL